MSETFYIKKTAFDDAGSTPADNAQRDSNSFIIGPGELNGPAGLNRDSDLELYGFGALKWGEGVDQNQYRQLENFACPQKETGDYWAAGSPPETAYDSNMHPVAPKDENDLGIGNGITEPLTGQSWYNTTDKTLYTFGFGSPATEWRSDMTATNTLDLAGYGIVNALDPRDNPTNLQGSPAIAYPQDVVTVGWADTRFVNITGDTMTGILDMGGNKLENVADPDSVDDAVNLGYADTRYINVIGDAMTGALDLGANKLTNVGNALTTFDPFDAPSQFWNDGRYLAKESTSGFNQLSGSSVLQIYHGTGANGNNINDSTLQIRATGAGDDAFIYFHGDGATNFNLGLDNNTNDLFVGGGKWGSNKYKVWHQANDGPGSGLNADLFDNYNSSSYLKTWDGYKKSSRNSPSFVFSRTFAAGHNDTTVYDTLTYSGRPSWANYVLLRFEWTCYDGNIEDLRWGYARMNGWEISGIGADDTDQGNVSAPFNVNECWVPYYHRSLATNVNFRDGGAFFKMKVYRIGWHQ